MKKLKKILTFVPLAVGIAAGILYIFNALSFRVVNNSYTMLQILSSLRIYLYVSIAGFVIYFFVRLILFFNYGQKTVLIDDEDDEELVEIEYDNEGNVVSEKVITKQEPKKKIETKTIVEPFVKTKTEIKEIVVTGNKYCSNCGEKIFDTDAYCKRCGVYQKDKKSGFSPLIRTIIYVIKIVVLLLILYFLVNMMFEYKEKQDPNFKSPLKIEMTK